MKTRPIALLSVYDKTGIAEFARELVELGWDIVASEGTHKELEGAGVPSMNIATFVGGGPILEHRVVTLSREIHAGLLARTVREDEDELQRLGLYRIDLVCVSFYPLQEIIDRDDADAEMITEMTDIGGPTLVRSAAKGMRIVLCDGRDRAPVLQRLKRGTFEQSGLRQKLKAKGLAYAASYDLVALRYHSIENFDGMVAERAAECSYGENKWQNASLFTTKYDDPLAISAFQLIHGAQPSRTNYTDLDRLLQTMTHIAAAFDVNYGHAPHAIAIAVKHGNPCGVGIADTPQHALKKMIAGDTRAIFGGAIMTNFTVREEEAEILASYKMPEGQRRLLDVIAAPAIHAFTGDFLQRKGGKCRLFTNPALARLNRNSLETTPHLRAVRGGFVQQTNYTFVMDFGDERLMRLKQALPHEERDMLLAWAIGSTSNSNTVTLVRGGMLLGNGVGQQDRVGACQLALARARDAGHHLPGASAYSDSFFPFVDGPTALANEGVRAILTSSGSVRDNEVQKFCREHNVILYMIPDEIGRGFFGH